MKFLTFLRGWRLTISAALALIALIVAGTFAAVRAQGQTCQDINTITLCADQFTADVPGFTNAIGNITIAQKGKQPYLIARSFEGHQARFQLRPGLKTGALAGAIGFVSDPQAQPLVSTKFNSDGSIKGYLEVDTATGNVQAVQAGVLPENPNPPATDYVYNYIDRAGVRSATKNGQTNASAPNFLTFFALERRFEGAAEFLLKLDGDENPDIDVIVIVKFSETGQLSGSVADILVRLAGLKFVLDGITLAQDPATKQAVFEVGRAIAFKVDNPDVPGLTDSVTEIFALEKVRYQNGRFTIGGGEVPIPDWTFGPAFKLTNQRIGLSFDEQTKTALFTVKSTLNFIDTSGLLSPFEEDEPGFPSKNIPIVLRIGGAKVNGQFKPVFQGGLQQFGAAIGKKLKLLIKNATLVGDTVQNFYGIQAQTIDLKWPAALGKQSAVGLAGLRVGVNKNLKPVFALAGGQFQLPPLKSGVLEGSNLAATVTVIEERLEVKVRGSAKINIPGNVGVNPTIDMFLRSGKGTGDAPSCVAPSCLQRFELKLSAFELSLAGFKLGLASPRGLEDGGFAADKATLSLPTGLGALGGEVAGLQVLGNGDVRIAGGGIEIPPIQLGNFQFVGLKGFFAKSAAGYEFKANGTLPLPGIEPGTGKPGIAATVIIRTKPDGGLQGLGVEVVFSATPGIPIGSTGMELTRIGGKFDIVSGTAQIGVSMRASTTARLIGIPLASVDGNATLQVNPFKLTANAKLAVLIFSVAQASLGIGDGQGFSGGPGMNVSFSVNAVIVKGEAKLRLGNVTVNGVKKLRVAASASYQVGLDKGQFGFLLPPFDINLTSVAFQGGVFKDSRSSPARETAGLLGSIKVGPFGASLFVDLSKKPTQGDFVDIVNADKLSLIEAARVRALAAQGVAGYSSRALGLSETQALGLSAASGAAVQQESIPLVITQTTTLVAGIHYSAGSPSIRLRLPDGGELNAGNVCVMTDATLCDSATRVLVRSSDPVKGNELAFIVKGAAPGSYTLIVDDAPADYTKVSYQLNEAPAATLAGTSCAGGATPGVTVTCNGAAAGGQVTIAWSAADLDSPDAKVSVGYARVQADGVVDPADMQLLAEERALGGGTLTWDLGEVPTGQYKLVVRVEDGSNAPVDAISSVLVDVIDQRAPAVPTGLLGKPLPGELLVNWTQNAERDLGGYEIGFGIVRPGVPDSAANFVYSRNMGPKEVVIAGTQVVDAKLWGLKEDEQIFFGIRAYDQSNNFSDWSPLLQARPWPLAPAAWTPTPGGAGAAATQVEAAFATPLQVASLANALELRRADGTIVPGSLAFITDLDGGQVIGLRFTPSAPLTDGAAYTAVLKGGVGGITAIDGRQMPEAYRWTFAARNQKVYLPLSVR